MLKASKLQECRLDREEYSRIISNYLPTIKLAIRLTYYNYIFTNHYSLGEDQCNGFENPILMNQSLSADSGICYARDYQA